MRKGQHEKAVVMLLGLEMAQELRAFVALEEDLNLVPSVHVL